MPNYANVDADMIASFRSDPRFAAFSDETTWPDDIVYSALYEADTVTGGSGWGSYKDLPRNTKLRGMYYFAAHWLSVQYTTQDASDPSNVSASARLNVAAKSVGDESVTYRVGEMQDTTEDWLSLTNYGVIFLRIKVSIGVGARIV